MSNDLVKLKYSHQALLDFILAAPTVTNQELAQVFGFSPNWISRVLNSDAFKEMIAKRKGELIDPLITQSFEERMASLAMQAQDILEKELADAPSFEKAYKVADLTTRALGYGAKPTAVVNNNVQNFVALMPAKSKTPEGWLEEHGPARLNEKVVANG